MSEPAQKFACVDLLGQTDLSSEHFKPSVMGRKTTMERRPRFSQDLGDQNYAASKWIKSDATSDSITKNSENLDGTLKTTTWNQRSIHASTFQAIRSNSARTWLTLFGELSYRNDSDALAPVPHMKHGKM